MAIHFASLKAHTSSLAAARGAARPPSSNRGIAGTAPPRLRSAGTTPSPGPESAAEAQAAQSAVPSFLALFSGVSGSPATPAPAAASLPAKASAPTAEGVFGPAPWLAHPTGIGPDGVSYDYNPLYFATPETAAAVAQMVGGTVVPSNEFTSAPGSTFQQQQPNLMVRLSNGARINPGLVAGFYTHGYPQSLIDQMIANEVANTKA